MRLYETAFLVAPTLPEEESEKLIEEMAGIVSGKKGKMINVDKWGKRRLAYPIKKFEDAVYVFFLYKGDIDIPAELERKLKQTEAVMRYMTVKMEERENIRGTKKDASRTAEAPREEKKTAEPAHEEKQKKETAAEEKKEEIKEKIKEKTKEEKKKEGKAPAKKKKEEETKEAALKKKGKDAGAKKKKETAPEKEKAAAKEEKEK